MNEDSMIVVLVTLESVGEDARGTVVTIAEIAYHQPVVIEGELNWGDEWNPWRYLHIGQWLTFAVPQEATP